MSPEESAFLAIGASLMKVRFLLFLSVRIHFPDRKRSVQCRRETMLSARVIVHFGSRPMAKVPVSGTGNRWHLRGPVSMMIDGMGSSHQSPAYRAHATGSVSTGEILPDIHDRINGPHLFRLRNDMVEELTATNPFLSALSSIQGGCMMDIAQRGRADIAGRTP